MFFFSAREGGERLVLKRNNWENAKEKVGIFLKIFLWKKFSIFSAINL